MSLLRYGISSFYCAHPHVDNRKFEIKSRFLLIPSQPLISIVSDLPKREELSSSLEYKLQHRPVINSDLRFDESQDESFFIKSVRLSSRLANRASREDLQRSNILPSKGLSSTGLSARLVAAQDALEKEQRLNKLNALLAARKVCTLSTSYPSVIYDFQHVLPLSYLRSQEREAIQAGNLSPEAK